MEKWFFAVAEYSLQMNQKSNFPYSYFYSKQQWMLYEVEAVEVGMVGMIEYVAFDSVVEFVVEYDGTKCEGAVKSLIELVVVESIELFVKIVEE